MRRRDRFGPGGFIRGHIGDRNNDDRREHHAHSQPRRPRRQRQNWPPPRPPPCLRPPKRFRRKNRSSSTKVRASAESRSRRSVSTSVCRADGTIAASTTGRGSCLARHGRANSATWSSPGTEHRGLAPSGSSTNSRLATRSSSPSTTDESCTQSPSMRSFLPMRCGSRTRPTTPTATLFACHPPGSIASRWVTRLQLVG